MGIRWEFPREVTWLRMETGLGGNWVAGATWRKTSCYALGCAMLETLQKGMVDGLEKGGPQYICQDKGRAESFCCV